MTAHLALRDQGVQRAGDALPPRAAVRLAVAGVGEEEAGPGQVDAAGGGDPVGLVAAAAAGGAGRGGGGAEHELAGDPELPRPAAHAGTSVLALSSLNNSQAYLYILVTSERHHLLCDADPGAVVLGLQPRPVLHQAAQPARAHPQAVREPAALLAELRSKYFPSASIFL